MDLHKILDAQSIFDEIDLVENHAKKIDSIYEIYNGRCSDVFKSHTYSDRIVYDQKSTISNTSSPVFNYPGTSYSFVEMDFSGSGPIKLG